MKNNFPINIKLEQILHDIYSNRKNIAIIITYEINNIQYYFVPQRKKYYGVVSNKLSKPTKEINIMPNKFMLTIQ